MTHQTALAGLQTPPAATLIPPPQAAEYGYNYLSYGSNVTLNSNYYLFNFLNKTPVTGQAAQQSDGSIILSPNGISDGSGYGANICSAYQAGSTWHGKVFGGGMYVEMVANWPATTGPSGLPFPAFWMLSIDFLMQNTLTWPGQASGYIHRIEVDFVQAPLPALPGYWAGVDVIDWYGSTGQSVSQPSNGLVNFAGASSASYNTYGALWVPVSASSPGFVMPFFNGKKQIYAAGSPIIQWNQYSASNAPPPVAGTTAGSLTDVSQFALIAGTRSTYPMQIKSINVWQKSEAGNTIQ